MNFVKSASLIALLKILWGTKLSKRGQLARFCELFCNYLEKLFDQF